MKHSNPCAFDSNSYRRRRHLVSLIDQNPSPATRGSGPRAAVPAARMAPESSCKRYGSFAWTGREALFLLPLKEGGGAPNGASISDDRTSKEARPRSLLTARL